MKVVVVMPAYNAARTLEKTVADIPKGTVHEIVIVDDCSKDDTVAVARALAARSPIPVHVEVHQKNRGYGGNQKTCYAKALASGADIIVMLHPDFQYDPRLIGHFVDYIEQGYFDVITGSRIRNRRETLEGGMPAYKYYANRLLTLWENILTGQNMSDWHSGMRVYRREVLEKVDFSAFSDDFVFDSQMLFSALKDGFKVAELPVPVRYFDEASSINFKRSVTYGLRTVWESLKQLWGVGIYKRVR